jgi:glycosyltransferase involved in cell wall biosynthesis
VDMLLISRCPPFPLYMGDRLIPYHLARQLSSRHYHIDLIAFYSKPHDLAEIPRYERYFRNIQLIREPERSTLDYFNRVRRPERMFPNNASEAWSPEMWNAINARLTSNRYDVVKVFGGIQVYEYRDLVCQLPNVIMPYESYSLFLKRQIAQQRERFRRLVTQMQLGVAQRYEKRMFEAYDRVVVLSESDEQALHALNPTLPIHVIPNGVDPDYFTPTGHEPDLPTLLFIGNYEYGPNLDAALRLARGIFPVVKQRAPQARLLLVGNNPPPSVMALADKDVEVTGHVPDLRPYLERALIFVSPLRYGAGIKNKILEAMAMQKPIVATPLSCDGIDLKNEKHVLYGNTPEELAKAVLRLIKEDDLRQNMAVANRQLIEARYTWRRVTDQYEELYIQAIQARGQRV